ncbi:MAG: TetR/AcrR family transcriptional regulator [Eisenbergiella sp.]
MRINRKEAICDAAAQLFNEKGYDQVSMREIAKQAGTTIGNLTYYFPKKEDIVIQIVSELHEDFRYISMQSSRGGFVKRFDLVI